MVKNKLREICLRMECVHQQNRFITIFEPCECCRASVILTNHESALKFKYTTAEAGQNTPSSSRYIIYRSKAVESSWIVSSVTGRNKLASSEVRTSSATDSINTKICRFYSTCDI